MTAVYADLDAHASPLRATVRSDLDQAHLSVTVLPRPDLEALALILAGALDPTADLHRALRWLTDAVAPEHADEYVESPRPLVVHRA